MTQAVKEAALAHFKEDLEGAVLNWAENRAKSKKYAAIAKDLAEFEEEKTGKEKGPSNSGL